jgi:hypothetical protein
MLIRHYDPGPYDSDGPETPRAGWRAGLVLLAFVALAASALTMGLAALLHAGGTR